MTLVADAPLRHRFAPARSMWRNLLVHVQPEAQAQPRLAAAADLARKLDAHLTGVGAEMLQPIGATDPYGMLGGEFVSAMNGAIQQNLTHAATVFQKQTEGLKTDWLWVEEFPSNAVARLARAADLIVTGGSPLNAHDPYRWCDPATAALQCGRPVLVVPPNGGTLEGHAVVVAWKDTREARRALGDALPILKCAEQVVVVAVCPKEEAADTKAHLASVRDYLLSHGVQAGGKTVVGHGEEVSGHIQAQARRINADLIVAGAYGHSRLGEWVFGGLTFDLLSDPQRFLLLSH